VDSAAKHGKEGPCSNCQLFDVSGLVCADERGTDPENDDIRRAQRRYKGSIRPPLLWAKYVQSFQFKLLARVPRVAFAMQGLPPTQ